MARLSNRFQFAVNTLCRSYNPDTSVNMPVWAPTLSLATTHVITIVLFSCAYLDVSVQRVRPLLGYPVFNRMGCPIRKPTDQSPLAAPRGLSQLDTSFFASESQGIPHTPLVTLSSVLESTRSCIFSSHDVKERIRWVFPKKKPNEWWRISESNR